MTDFDKKLIEKANAMKRWDYRNIDVLIAIADSAEARERLTEIRWDMREALHETM